MLTNRSLLTVRLTLAAPVESPNSAISPPPLGQATVQAAAQAVLGARWHAVSTDAAASIRAAAA